MATRLPILVADDDREYRTQIARLLERVGYATETAQTGREALDAARRLKPALVMLEVNLPEVSGYEVCRQIRDTFGTDVAVFFLSADRTEPNDRVAGLLLGADDYIVKPFEADELLARIRSALRRFAIFPNADRESAASTGRLLTRREREVLRLLARGLNQRDIAGALFISPKTVATHIQRVLTKLGVHSRAQAVAAAYERGLTDVEAEAHSLVAQG
jgi:DNA-binding NarL/FixJ family response regulator